MWIPTITRAKNEWRDTALTVTEPVWREKDALWACKIKLNRYARIPPYIYKHLIKLDELEQFLESL